MKVSETRQAGAYSRLPFEVVESPPKERVVKQFDVYQYYQLGTQMHELDVLRRDIGRREAMFTIFKARHALWIFRSEQQAILPLSLHAAGELINAFDRTSKSLFQDKEGKIDETKNWEEILPSWWFGGIVQALETFQHVLAAETRQSATYFAPQVGIYEMSSLADQAWRHIPETHRQHLSPEAMQDFGLAGRCLAFGLPTAAGFHALRATESLLDDYYGRFAGAEKKELKTWGDYISELKGLCKGKAVPKPSEKTIRVLDQLRDLDRNPLMHPRSVLDETEAQVLFNLVTSAIVAMATEIKMLEGQPELALPAPVEEKKAG